MIQEIFSGEALSVRLPDIYNDKGKREPCYTITWPDMVHKIFVNNNKDIIEVLGADLQRGMVIDVLGQTALVVDIEPIKYHGLRKQNIMISYKSEKDITRKNFKRNFFEDGKIEWELLDERENKDTFNRYKPKDGGDGDEVA